MTKLEKMIYDHIVDKIKEHPNERIFIIRGIIIPEVIHEKLEYIDYCAVPVFGELLNY